jgi:MFS family permease
VSDARVQPMWASREFRLVFAGVGLSLFGDSLLLLVLAIWVKSLTGSNAQAGATFVLLGVPSLLSPLGGYVVDRLRRRPFLIAVNALSALILLPLLLVHDAGDVPIIYTTTFLYGVSLALTDAAMNGLLKELLPDAWLAGANGALQTVQQGSRLVAPLIGAGVFASVGGGAVAGLDAATFLAAAAALLAVRLDEPRPEPPSSIWRSEMAAGAAHIFGNTLLRRATLACAVCYAFIGFGESTGFAVNESGLHRPPAFVGVLVSVQGIGALAGGLLAGRIVRRLGESNALGVGLVLWGIGGSGWLSTHLSVVMAGNVVLGFGLPLQAVAVATLLQRRTPSRLMGRASAATHVLIGGPLLVSVGAGAALITVVDYRLLVAASFLAISAAGLWLLAATRKDRNWRQWHDDYLDPSSDLSQRLAVVQQGIRDWADALPPGSAWIVSICAGQGHDVVGGLREHPRCDDVNGLLVELDPDNVAAANEALRDAGLTGVPAVVGDAGNTASYDGVVPADLVLACGVFGNISDDDVQRTVSALPSLCAAGATVIWTRHRRDPDLTPAIRSWFTEAGFEEVAFTSPGPDRFAVGVHRLVASPLPFRPGLRLFAFVRR